MSGRKGNKTKIFSETKWREKNLLLITIKNQLSIWEYCTTLKCRFNTRHPSFRSCSFLFEPDNHGKKFIMLIGNLLPHNIRCTTTQNLHWKLGLLAPSFGSFSSLRQLLFLFFLSVVWLSWNFVRFFFKQMLKISVFYLIKQKSFIPKKIWFRPESLNRLREFQQMAFAVPIFSEGFASWKNK